jgi:hypothetical protein
MMVRPACHRAKVAQKNRARMSLLKAGGGPIYMDS